MNLILFGDINELGSVHNINLPLNIKDIISIEVGFNICYLISSHYQLFKLEINEKLIINELIFFKNILISKVSSKNKHVGVVTKEGKVFLWGNNENEIINGPKIISEENPIEIPLNIPAIDIKTGGYFTMILLENGEILSFGINHDNILGLNKLTYKINLPTLINKEYFFNKKILKISTGWSHTLVLNEENLLFSWGRSNFGRLGHEKGDEIFLINTNLNLNIIDIECGDTNSFCLFENGIVKATGWNNNGELGFGDKKARKYLKKINELNNIIKISSGTDHTLFLNSNGELFGVGNNLNGKIGLQEKNLILNPLKINLNGFCLNISSGIKYSLILIKK